MIKQTQLIIINDELVTLENMHNGIYSLCCNSISTTERDYLMISVYLTQCNNYHVASIEFTLINGKLKFKNQSIITTNKITMNIKEYRKLNDFLFALTNYIEERINKIL